MTVASVRPLAYNLTSTKSFADADEICGDRPVDVDMVEAIGNLWALAKLTIYKEQYVWWAETKLEFTKKGTGYAYQTQDGQQLLIMTMEERKHSFMELARKS